MVTLGLTVEIRDPQVYPMVYVEVPTRVAYQRFCSRSKAQEDHPRVSLPSNE